MMKKTIVSLSLSFLLLLSFLSLKVDKELDLSYKVKASSLKNGKAPLILLLHGYGSNEEDLFDLAQQFPRQFIVVSARAPYIIANNGYAWFHANFSTDPPTIQVEELEKSILTLNKFIFDIQKKYNADASHTYLIGFSQGAMMSYALGIMNPEKYRGIAPLSGRLPDVVKQKAANNASLKSLKVFISHGTEDNVIKVERGREANQFLLDKGMKPEYHEYSMAHQISGNTLSDLVKWIEKSEK